MKKLPLLLCAFPLVGAAADLSSLAFPDRKIGLPSFSLRENSREGPLNLLGETGAWFRNQSPAIAPAKKFISKMPILHVTSDVDPKMVKTPDPSIDYKLIVKTPNVESAK